MSRIGKQPIKLPAVVKVTVDGTAVQVEGPKGVVRQLLSPQVGVTIDPSRVLTVKAAGTSRLHRAMSGTTRALIANMVKGVTEGYTKELEIHGVGFKAVVKGNVVDLALGYSHPILYTIPKGIKLSVVEGTKVKIEGCDKQQVGAVAAEIRSYYPPEPYKGKGVRIVGERVRRKEGKTVA